MNPLEISGYFMCYLCDPVAEVRNLAALAIDKVDCRFLFCNFQSRMAAVLDYVIKYYGEIEV